MIFSEYLVFQKSFKRGYCNLSRKESIISNVVWYFKLNFLSYNDEKPKDDKIPSKIFTFEGADINTAYTVKVALVLNGKTIAATQKTLKSMKSEGEETDSLSIKEYLWNDDFWVTFYNLLKCYSFMIDSKVI